jgi:K+-transporting ATPase KdpC subunit
MSTVKIISHTETPAPAGQSSGSFLGHVYTAIAATVVLGIIVCGLYPLIVFVIGQVFFPVQANGSLLTKDGSYTTDPAQAVGSALLGQSFSAPQYFHPRPSAAGGGYDATASGGSNLGPLSAKLLHGTTKNVAYTVFAADKDHAPVTSIPGRVQAMVVEVTKTSITVTPPAPATQSSTASSTASQPAGPKTTYTLDAAVADPNTVVNFHGRTIHATAIPIGSIIELKMSDKTPPAVTAINVADQENDGGLANLDANANKITLDDATNTVINVDPTNTAFILNGKTAALADLAPGMKLHVVVSAQMDYDGIADRVIHYCQDNAIAYKSSVPDSTFTDADGLDDYKLVTAFSAADNPTIVPAIPIPADAVTASGSGLDPHISPENARLQVAHVLDARKDTKITKDQLLALIDQYTDKPNLGILGDPGINVLRLNLALDTQFPMPAARQPASAAASSATTAPEAQPK